MQSTVRHACGYALIAAGIAGIVLPIIPGIPLLLGGMAMLGSGHPLVRRGQAWLRRRGFLKEKGGQQRAG